MDEDPLASIPCLIPLPVSKTPTPSNSRSRTPRPPPPPAMDLDPFDSLFSSTSSPPAKPLFSKPSTSRSTTELSAANLTAPEPTSPEFGSFVSVEPSTDPLFTPFTPGFPDLTATPTTESPTATSNFVQEAKQRAKQREQKILDEFWAHEDDPLEFINHGAITQQQAVGAPPMERRPSSPSRTDSESTAVSSPIAIPTSPTQSSPIDPFFSSEDDNQSSTKKPPTKKRSSGSHPSRSQNASSPPHPRLTSTLPRRLSNLLSQPLPSPAHGSDPHSTTPPLPQFSPPQSTFTYVANHSATLPPLPSSGHAARPSAASIFHSSPFASHPYIPPSGAPGFKGDRNWDKGFSAPNEEITSLPTTPVKLLGRLPTTHPIMSAPLASHLRTHLPPLARLPHQWSLLYSLDQHGISISTFYSRVEAHDGNGVIIVIRDDDAEALEEKRSFGVWVGDGVRRVNGKGYYGSGESFLWKAERKRDTSDDDPNVDVNLKVFKWTGKNDYVALTDSDFISFGGGDGKYGLYVDSNFLDGSSARCLTFDNDILCAVPPGLDVRGSKTVRFECVGLEVWGVGGSLS